MDSRRHGTGGGGGGSRVVVVVVVRDDVCGLSSEGRVERWTQWHPKVGCHWLLPGRGLRISGLVTLPARTCNCRRLIGCKGAAAGLPAPPAGATGSCCLELS